MIQVYHLKQSGQNIEVRELFRFSSNILASCTHTERHKVTNKLLLCIGGELGLEIRSIEDNDKGELLHEITNISRIKCF